MGKRSRDGSRRSPPTGSRSPRTRDTQEAVPLRSLVKLTRDPRVPIQTPEGSHVLLPEGDRLMRVIVGATTDTAIEVQSQSALGKITIPLECVLGLILTAPTESDGFDQLWNRVAGEPRSTEVVWMANGDRHDGWISWPR